jgi:hypothetical protein
MLPDGVDDADHVPASKAISTLSSAVQLKCASYRTTAASGLKFGNKTTIKMKVDIWSEFN